MADLAQRMPQPPSELLGTPSPTLPLEHADDRPDPFGVGVIWSEYGVRGSSDAAQESRRELPGSLPRSVLASTDTFEPCMYCTSSLRLADSSNPACQDPRRVV
jgi:hypothetical protein